MSITTEPYRTRPIRFLDLWEDAGWRVKIYGISSLAETPEPKFIDMAKEIASQTLPTPATDRSRYGVAFVTIHQAKLFNQIIIDWWEHINELRHRVFKAHPEHPYLFEEITGSGEALCIWELRVIGFERDAWLKAVLKSPCVTSIEDYLSLQLNEDA